MLVAAPTGAGLGHLRNAVIGSAADAVVAIGGGAGTLSEVCFAWGAAAAVIVVVEHVAGSCSHLAGQRLDGRVPHGRQVVGVRSAEQAVAEVVVALRREGLLSMG